MSSDDTASPEIANMLGGILKTYLKSSMNPWLYHAFKNELVSIGIGLRWRVDLRWLLLRQKIAVRKNVLANIGCGPTGRAGWINLDLYPSPGVTMRVDCRRGFPLGDSSCRGIHVEHYFEHLHSAFEKPKFLAECFRCLEPGGVLRIIVPDARKYIEAYLDPGWASLNAMGCGEDVPQEVFETKIEALNHVFMQAEHYGGVDFEYLSRLLRGAGFSNIEQQAFGIGKFPDGCIDNPEHASYSLYVEARR